MSIIENSKKQFNIFFPGKNLEEKIKNEIKDFFYTGPLRVEFFWLSGYAFIVLLIAYFLSRSHHFEGFSIKSIYLSFIILGIYFVISDFLKRKKILSKNKQFYLDAIMYSIQVGLIIYSSGGHNSLFTFPLLFLCAISAPIYGTLLKTFIFLTVIILIDVSFTYQMHGLSIELIVTLFTNLSFFPAAGIISTALKVTKKETKKFQDLSNTLNEKVQEKTQDLQLKKEALDKRIEIINKQKELAERKEEAMLNILEDLQKEKEKVVTEKEKIEIILSSIGDGVFVIDKNQKIILFNKIAEQISGFTIKEAINKPYKEVLQFLDEKKGKVYDKFINKALTSSEIQNMPNNIILVRKDGKKVPVNDSSAPLVLKAGGINGCVVVFRDVTKEREIEKMKSEFVSVASHQLRTPLTSIKWLLEMMLDGDAGKITKKQTEYVENVFDSNERMIALVNDLLNISRIESGKIKIIPQEVQLENVILDVEKNLKPLAEKKKINLLCHYPKQKLPKVFVDPTRIGEAIKNLISNSIKYTKEGGRVDLLYEKKHDDLIFMVKDNGVGIPKDQQNRIFERFFRAENIIKMQTEGTGLGLYITKSIIESSQGKIWFESQIGKGTTFFISLPIKK